jgi:hypothetical protein
VVSVSLETPVRRFHAVDGRNHTGLEAKASPVGWTGQVFYKAFNCRARSCSQ